VVQTKTNNVGKLHVNYISIILNIIIIIILIVVIIIFNQKMNTVNQNYQMILKDIQSSEQKGITPEQEQNIINSVLQVADQKFQPQLDQIKNQINEQFGGSKIRYGVVAGGADNKGTVSFNYTFNNNPVVICQMFFGGDQARIWSIVLRNVTTTGFDYIKFYSQGGDDTVYGSASEPFAWIAIGN